MAISSNGDKYFSNVSLLLPFDGANNGTAFYDASPKSKTFLRYGDTKTVTTQSKFGRSSAYFDGVGDYLRVGPNTDCNLASNDFTIEGWIYLQSGSGDRVIIGKWIGPGNLGWVITCNAQNNLAFYYTTDGNTGIFTNYTNGYIIPNDSWTHICVTRSGNVLKLYINGVARLTNSNFTANIYNSLDYVNIAYAPGGSVYFKGYIDSLRITDNLARYSSDFTPPTTAFPTDWEDVPDPDYDNVVLLLPMDGAESSTTFVDRSKTPKTVTTVGNTSIKVAQSKFGGRSAYFDGSSDYLSCTANSDFNFGTGNFTIEAWIYLAGDSALSSGNAKTACICGNITAASTSGFGFYIKGDASTTGTGITLEDESTGSLTVWSVTSTVTKNTWHHVVVSRNNNNLMFFLDGLLLDTKTLLTERTIGSSIDALTIGALTITGYNYAILGYIDSLRITKGTARYTSNFTVPTGPFAIGKPYTSDPYASNVKLLLTGSGAHGSQCFRDESGLGNVITVAGNTTIGRGRSKIHGGSIYFDGSGDYLELPDSVNLQLGAGDFTIEAWAYCTANTLYNVFFSKGAAEDGLFFGTYQGTNNLRVDLNFTGYTFNSTITLNQWCHVAIVRSGTSVNVFVNGVKDSYTLIASEDISVAGTVARIGRGRGASANYLTGYLNGLKITKGTARYTANFTPTYTQLLPPASISGDSLYDNTVLTLRLDGNYVDSSPKNNLVYNFGLANLSTTTYKYGTGSLELNGSNSFIATADNADFRFGTGDFCVECWVRPTGSYKTRNSLFDHKTGTSGWQLYLNSSGNIVFTTESILYTVVGNISLSLNTWHHIAVTRASSTLTIWLNGVADQTSGGFSADISGTTTYLGIGALINTRESQYDFQGYIDNVRITKGAARYTSAFTPTDIESGTITGPVRAYSNESITSNGAVKFTIPVAGVIQAGFSTNASTDVTKDDLEYSIQIDSSKSLKIIESGVVKGTIGTAADGANYEIEYSGTTMIYKSNGAQLLTTTVTAGMTLYFSAFIEDTGLYVTGIQIGQYANDGTPGNISGQITADNISTYIASVAIGETYIANAAITNAKIDNLAVTEAKIDNLAVTTAKIDNLAVTEGKIDNLAVSTLKIAGQAVTVPETVTIPSYTFSGISAANSTSTDFIGVISLPVTSVDLSVKRILFITFGLATEDGAPGDISVTLRKTVSGSTTTVGTRRFDMSGKQVVGTAESTFSITFINTTAANESATYSVTFTFNNGIDYKWDSAIAPVGSDITLTCFTGKR